MRKGEQLRNYYKKISGIESEFERNTAELVGRVHRQRQEQVINLTSSVSLSFITNDIIMKWRAHFDASSLDVQTDIAIRINFRMIVYQSATQLNEHIE